MPWSGGFDLCIKCNLGGKLLVCNGHDCPILVHQNCMASTASSCVVGGFDCPYCVFRKAYAEFNLAREDVDMLKRGLSAFIDAKMADCHKNKEKSERGKRKRKASLCEVENAESLIQKSNASKGVDSVHEVEVSEHEFEVEDVGRTEDQIHRRVDGLILHRDAECNQENANLIGSPSQQEKLSEVEKDDSKSLEENDIRENSLGETASSNENNSSFDFSSGADGGGETSNKRSNTKKAVSRCESPSANVDCGRRSSPIMRKNPRQAKKTNIANEVSQKTISPGGRRILWTEQEEEMIKKGVIKYTSTGNKNIPWRKIFEFGRHVFHYSRTPIHLKDKWRTMLAKENLAK